MPVWKWLLKNNDWLLNWFFRELQLMINSTTREFPSVSFINH
jgi:hypothetical protein